MKVTERNPRQVAKGYPVGHTKNPKISTTFDKETFAYIVGIAEERNVTFARVVRFLVATGMSRTQSEAA